jgi:3-hydroxy-9,10-secoandrosta-1,3,5(10)-triene-9,17-dione monooxygenase
VTTQTTTTPVDRGELLRRAREIAPRLKERAFETETLGQVPDESREEILAAELVKIGTPVKYGGIDVEFETLHEVTMEFARVCGATAWVYTLWGLHSWWLGYWPKEVQEELYADSTQVLSSSTKLTIDCRYEQVRGGYRLSGHGAFSSGCDHADWLFAVAPGPDGVMQMLLPRTDFRVLGDTWNVSGLKGTGTKEVVVEDAFVPDHRIMRPTPPLDMSRADEPTPFGDHPQRRYTVPMFALMGWDLASVSIGLAQGAVDEMVARMTGTTGSARSADSAVVHAAIAEAAAEVDAAKALLHVSLEDAQNKGQQGVPFEMIDLARYIRNQSYSQKLASQATTRMMSMGGARALSLKDPLQRIHRDIQATIAGPLAMFPFASQPYGRAALGLDAGAVLLGG